MATVFLSPVGGVAAQFGAEGDDVFGAHARQGLFAGVAVDDDLADQF